MPPFLRTITLQIEVPDYAPDPHPQAAAHAFYVRPSNMLFGGMYFSRLDTATEYWARHQENNLVFACWSENGRLWESYWSPTKDCWEPWKENLQHE